MKVTPEDLPENNAKIRSHFSPKVIPISKFAIWSFCTGGIYILFWSYWQWKYLKEKNNSYVSPFWRSFFIFFSLYDLINELKKIAKQKSIDENIKPSLILVSYIVFCLGIQLPNIALMVSIKLPSPIVLFSFFNFIPIIPVLNLTNKISLQEEKGGHNEKFAKWWEYVLISVTGIWTVLILIVLLVLKP